MSQARVSPFGVADSFVLGNGDDIFYDAPGFSDGDSVSGGNGEDVISVRGDWLTLSGDNGDDYVGLLGDDGALFGGNGDDTMMAIGRRSYLEGGRGSDRLISNSSTYSFYDYGLGNSLSGGQGADVFWVCNQSDLIVNNNSGSGSDVVNRGDRIQGLIDVITDYEVGDIIRIDANRYRSGVIGLDGFARGHQHLELADGEYAVFAGTFNGDGTFDVGGGADSLLVWDSRDGRDEPFFQGALAVAGVTPAQLVVVPM